MREVYLYFFLCLRKQKSFSKSLVVFVVELHRESIGKMNLGNKSYGSFSNLTMCFYFGI